MAVQLNIKTQAPPQSTVAVDQLSTEEKVDRLADLLVWEAKLKKDARLQELVELKAWFRLQGQSLTEANEFGPDNEIEFEGSKHRYILGPQSKTRTFKEGAMPLLAKKLKTAFFELCSFPLGELDKYVTEPDRKLLLDFGRGDRSGKMLDKKG